MTSIIGIDPGDKRIGVAVADLDTRIITPLTTLSNNRSFVTELKKLHDKYNFDIIVIGLPITGSGLRGKQAKKVLALAEKIKSQLPITIELEDERYTSKAALTHLQTIGEDKAEVDTFAAILILKSWLSRSKL